MASERDKGRNGLIKMEMVIRSNQWEGLELLNKKTLVID
jgi:hypothetical protein